VTVLADGRTYDGFVPGRYPIDAYGAGGFRVSGERREGSLLILGDEPQFWAPTAIETLTPADFKAIFEPLIENYSFVTARETGGRYSESRATGEVRHRFRTESRPVRGAS